MSFSQLDGFSGYNYCTQNGVVRLDPNTGPKIEGLSTSGLKTCLGLILYNSAGKISVSHVHSKRTNVDKAVLEELLWMGEATVVQAIIVQNQRFLSEHLNHVWNVSEVLNGIRALLVCNGVAEHNISVMDTKNGAFAINRQSLEVIIPENDTLDDDNVFVGTPCPYVMLRRTVLSLACDGLTNIDIQYDGVGWTKMKDLGYYGVALSADRIQRYEGLTIAQMAAKLRTEPALQRLLTVGNVLNEGEFDTVIESESFQVHNYLVLRKEYENAGNRYKMFTMTSEQRSTIESIDGAVLPEKDRGMYLFQAPTQLLDAKVRQILQIDRFVFREKDMPKFVGHFTSTIPFWKGEQDMAKKGSSVWITFPYRSESERVRMRKELNAIIASTKTR